MANWNCNGIIGIFELIGIFGIIGIFGQRNNYMAYHSILSWFESLLLLGINVLIIEHENFSQFASKNNGPNVLGGTN